MAVASASRRISDAVSAAAALAGMVLAAAVLDALGVIFYLLAAYRGSLSLMAILASLYPGSTVLMATAVLGKRLHRGRIWGGWPARPSPSR